MSNEKLPPPSQGQQPTAAAQQSTPDAADSDERRRLPVVQPGAQLTRPPTGNVVAQAWLVLVLAAGFGASLAGLEYALGPKIAENKLNETLSQVPALVPGAVSGQPDDQAVPGRRVFRAVNAEGTLLGWVVPGKGQGFADQVELIIGLDASAARLTGVFVLDQKETPGLGDNITTPEFLRRFVGMSTSVQLDAQQAPTDQHRGVVKALTGATISSDTVCSIINKTVDLVEKPLAAAAQGSGAGEGGR
jgi:electron transport complex protein RnfG